MDEEKELKAFVEIDGEKVAASEWRLSIQPGGEEILLRFYAENRPLLRIGQEISLCLSDREGKVLKYRAKLRDLPRIEYKLGWVRIEGDVE